MSRLSLFSSPLFLGFDQVEQTMDRIAKTADGYPPYNVEQLDERRLRITLAVAGFAPEDLTVEREANQLQIRGKQSEPEAGERVFLHRGIATRQFQRTFVLADGIEVSGARLEQGLLHVDLEQPLTQTSVRRIDIAIGGADAAGGLAR